MSFSIRSKLWVESLVKRANLAGSYALVARKGDNIRGDVVIKTQSSEGVIQLYGRAFTIDGTIAFEKLLPNEKHLDEATVENYLQKRIRSDPDLWIIEVEGKSGHHFIVERIVSDEDNNEATKAAERIFK